jgi:L-lactate dehydrogenase complex protein LldG
VNSRAEILAKVRKHAPPPVALPELNENWITYPDRCAQFASVLQFVGGSSRPINRRSEARSAIESLPYFASSKQIVCAAPDIGLGNIDLNHVADPHDLSGVDLAIVDGEFGVAENAAVWIDGAKLKHRVVLFLAQHLVLVVSAKSLFDNMHQAYERLSFTDPGYGVFISGPSKTADIEQSLVIGAHGARSLTVLLVNH